MTRPAASRRRAAAGLVAVFALALSAPAIAACPEQRTLDPSVPTWRAVNGFDPGQRRSTTAELDRYLAAVDAASDRVSTATLATSAQGRPIRYALVSRPANLARLDAISSTLRGLRLGKAGATRARRAAAREPAAAWVAGGVHGDEPSGSDAAARLLYELAAGRDCATRRRLERLVTVIVPVQNPDGREADTRANGAGFDLNRDWFARTQPETVGKIALLRRLPPVMFVDAHEEASSAFFFPPNVDPVYHEVPVRALRAIDGVFSAALRRAFEARDIAYRTGTTYDLFYPGYGDSAPTTAFGAAGMTFEKGASAPLATRVQEQFVAQDAALGAAADHKDSLLERWAAGWREARAQGARGLLAPNRSLQRGARPQTAVPRGRVYAYVLRADRSPSEVARLVERLRAFDVEVLRLRREVRVSSLDPYGAEGPRAARLPAGTFWVPLAQGPKHWVQTLLNEQTYAPFPYFYDVSAWSNALLMGVQGGAIGDPRRPRALRRVSGRVRLGGAPAGASAAYAFATDGTGALALLADLRGRGVEVRRATRSFRDGARRFAPGTAVVDGAAPLATLRGLGRARNTPIVSLTRVPGATSAPAPARVGVLGDLEPAAGTSSAGWARWVLARRLGLAAQPLGAQDLERSGAALARLDALVVPDGALSPGALSAAALGRIASWVRAGGTYVGLRSRGVALARAAGLTEERATFPEGLRSPGALVAVEPARRDPLAWGLADGITVPDEDDPVLAGPAPAALRVPRRDGFVSGFLEGAGALRGAPVATAETVGAGRVILLSFDPGFRGYAEAAQRVLGNAVLYPRAAGAAAATAGAPAAPVRPGELRRLPQGSQLVVRVPVSDVRALRAAAARVGVPPAARVVETARGAELRAPDPARAGAEGSPWLRAVLADLSGRGIRPTLVIG